MALASIANCTFFLRKTSEKCRFWLGVRSGAAFDFVPAAAPLFGRPAASTILPVFSAKEGFGYAVGIGPTPNPGDSLSRRHHAEQTVLISLVPIAVILRNDPYSDRLCEAEGGRATSGAFRVKWQSLTHGKAMQFVIAKLNTKYYL